MITGKRPSPVGEITTYRLVNARGNEVRLSSLGAGITGIDVPDAWGNKADVVLGYADAADYLDDSACAGKTPGRYANRIARGRFSLDGTEYTLAVNNPPNALHGGPRGFHNVVWLSEERSGAVVFTYHAKDGEEGYPGNMDVSVTYEWSDADELTISYRAVADKVTVVNLTNHAYFNLSGEGVGSCLDHMLTLDCARWLPADDTDIPLGTVESVDGTPMDFTHGKALGRDISADYYNLRTGKGYNHFFMINGWRGDGRLLTAAKLDDARSGRRLTVATTQCGVMLYTGNWLANNSPVGKCGRRYADHDGVAIECQGAPDAPNQSALPSQVLRPDEVYNHVIRYSFSNTAQM